MKCKKEKERDSSFYISKRIYLLTERWALQQLQYIFGRPSTLHHRILHESLNKGIRKLNRYIGITLPLVNRKLDAAPVVTSPSTAISDQASKCHRVQSLIICKKNCQCRVNNLLLIFFYKMMLNL